MIYFLDNTFSKQMAEILRMLKVEAIHLQEEYAAETKDADWIPEVALKGYTLITGDGRIRKGSAERAALEQSQLPAIFLYNGYTNTTIWEQVAFLVRHWPVIEKEARKMQSGDTRYLGVNGNITTYEALAAKRKK